MERDDRCQKTGGEKILNAGAPTWQPLVEFQFESYGCLGLGWGAPSSFVIFENGDWTLYAEYCRNDNVLGGSGSRPNGHWWLEVQYLDQGKEHDFAGYL
jgi:hypothetical protein